MEFLISENDFFISKNLFLIWKMIFWFQELFFITKIGNSWYQEFSSDIRKYLKNIKTAPQREVRNIILYQKNRIFYIRNSIWKIFLWGTVHVFSYVKKFDSLLSKMFTHFMFKMAFNFISNDHIFSDIKNWELLISLNFLISRNHFKYLYIRN